MIQLNDNNITRFTKRLQQSIENEIKTKIKLSTASKILAQIYGVQTIQELKNFCIKNDQTDQNTQKLITKIKETGQNDLLKLFQNLCSSKEYKNIKIFLQESTVIKSLSSYDFEYEIIQAINDNDLQLIKLLSPFIIFSQYETVLQKACVVGNLNTIIILFNDFKILSNKELFTDVFLYSCENGHYDLVNYFIKNNVDVNQVVHMYHEKQYTFTALQEAAQAGHLNIVKLLIENDADIEAHDNLAFKAVCKYKQFEIFQFFILENKINLNNELINTINSIPEIKNLYISLNKQI